MVSQMKSSLLFMAVIVLLAACQPATPEPMPADMPAALPATVQPSPTALPAPTEEVIPAATDTPQAEAEPATPAVLSPDGSLILMPVAQFGGSVTAFAVENELLFVTLGPRLVIYRITNPAQPQQVGSFPLVVVGSDVVVQDQRVYLVDGEGHMLVFHTADPETMYVSAAFEGAGSSRIFVDGDWGFTTSDTCIEGSCTSELKVFSLVGLTETPPVFAEGAIGPDLPITASLETPGGIVHVFSDEQYAYISHQNGILIASLPDLRVVGQLEENFVNNAVVQYPYIYLSGWGFLKIADVADAAAPTWVEPAGMSAHPTVGTAAAIAGEYLYGYESIGEFGHCTSELRAVDLSNPIQPDAVALADTKPDLTCASRLLSDGNLLLALDWNGLHLIDVEQPAFPTLISSIENLPGTVEVLVDGYGFGRSGSGLDPLMVHDFNTLDAVLSYGPFSPGWILRIVQKDGYLFIPAWEDGLHVVDIADPTFPTSAVHIGGDQLDGPGLDVSLSGDLLFVARAESGIAVFDVGDPAQTVRVGQFSPPPAGDIWVRTSRVAAGDGYVVALEEMWQDNVMNGRLNVFDLSSAPDVEKIAQVDIEQTFVTSDLLADGRYAYLLVSGCQAVCKHHLLILDMQNPSEPLVLSSLDLPGEANSLTLHGEHVFVAAGSAGVYAWNVADPAQPTLSAQVNTPGEALRTAAEGDLLVVSDGAGGLVVYQIME
jgi:hypothetical protein